MARLCACILCASAFVRECACYRHAEEVGEVERPAQGRRGLVVPRRGYGG